MISEVHHVDGEDRGKIILYALSTCIFCMRTKKLLDKHGVQYDYIDIDLLDNEHKAAALEKMKKYNPRSSFPTLVINDDICLIGYKEKEIEEVLGIHDKD
jgi:glutaredoxin